jgi:hypothetical protein
MSTVKKILFDAALDAITKGKKKLSFGTRCLGYEKQDAWLRFSEWERRNIWVSTA